MIESTSEQLGAAASMKTLPKVPKAIDVHILREAWTWPKWKKAIGRVYILLAARNHVRRIFHDDGLV